MEKTISNTGRRRVNEAGQGKQLFKCLCPKPRETTEAHTDEKLFKDGLERRVNTLELTNRCVRCK